jgi:hypothetical protein
VTREHIFNLISIGSLLLPCLVALVVQFVLPWPKHWFARGVVAVCFGWAILVIYTALIYNPAGIALATEQGIDSPGVRYDNNTIASALLGGWLMPALALAVFFAARNVWVRFTRSAVVLSNSSAPNKPLHATALRNAAREQWRWATQMIGDVPGIIAVAVVASSIAACTSPNDDGGIPGISVTVEPNGAQCLIAELEMPCAEVGAYIRDVAKIERDKRIVVTGDPGKTDHRHFLAVIKSIEETGYTFVIGTFYIAAPQPTQ